MPGDQAATLQRLRRLEKALDRQFEIAGFRFGFDSLIGLVPVVGDLMTGALGYYLISEARRLGVSRFTLARMYSNWGADLALGALPIVGDVFDVVSSSDMVILLISDAAQVRFFGFLSVDERPPSAL